MESLFLDLKPYFILYFGGGGGEDKDYRGKRREREGHAEGRRGGVRNSSAYCNIS